MAVRGRRGRPHARYRVRDWAAYDRALARRRDITVWVSPEAVATWRASAGRRTFTDAAIAAALTVRAVYRLALPQAERLIRSIFGLLGLSLPADHTTLSRRGRAMQIGRCSSAGGGPELAIDSTGLRLARPPGARHEGWWKLRVAVEPDTGQTLAEELTRSDVHDTVARAGAARRDHGPDRTRLRRCRLRWRAHLPRRH
jgi:hypothetical protein